MSKEDEKYFANFYKNWKQKNPAPPKRTTVAKKDPETKKKVLNTPAVVKTKAAATKTPCIPCDKENSAPQAAPAIAPPVVVNPIDSTDDSDKPQMYLYEELIARARVEGSNLKMMIFSGDDDSSKYLQLCIDWPLSCFPGWRKRRK